MTEAMREPYHAVSLIANNPQLLHHHTSHRLRPERNRSLPSYIRLDLELLILAHHIEEPVVCLPSREKAVGGREAKGHLGGG